jgi:hypothetical protein
VIGEKVATRKVQKLLPFGAKIEEAYRLRSSMKKGKRGQKVLKEFLEKRMEGCDTE